MNLYDLLSFGEALGVVVLGGASVIFSQRAAKLSAPTGNGWTEVLGHRLDAQDAAMARIEVAQRDAQQQFIDHLQVHLNQRGTP